MARQPVIAVTTDVKTVDGYRWYATVEHYVNAVAEVAGCLPMLLPSLGDTIDIEGVLDNVDGVLATGSRSNVHPSIYGSDKIEETLPHDPDRDATTLPLIRRAVERGVPLLAICRGHQEFNVAMGGTLESEIQNKVGTMDHRAPDVPDNDDRFEIRQVAKVQPGCTLDRALSGLADKKGQILINSLHRQAIKDLAPGLFVEAVAEDGTIEATSIPGAPGFVLSVQWHPEYWAGEDPVSTAILRSFGDAARAYRGGQLAAAE